MNICSRGRGTAILLAVLLILTGILSSCNDSESTKCNGTSGVIKGNDATVEASTLPKVEAAEEAIVGIYSTSENDISVNLSDSTSTSDEAYFSGGKLTISSQGTYIITGTLEDGQIIIDTASSEKVKLILNGISVSCSNGPAIYVKSAPKKVILYTAEQSVNILSDSTSYITPDEDRVDGEVYPNACIYSCDDLKLDGLGKLYVTGNADKGINTKDDLEICGGTVVVQSKGVGIRGNDSVMIEGGIIHIVSGGDGIKTANTDSGNGSLNILGGELYIETAGDGISSSAELSISGGKAVIATKNSEPPSASAGSNITGISYGSLQGPGGMPGGNMWGTIPGGNAGGTEGNTNKSETSTKGIKAASILTINGGNITTNTVDDGIHSNDIVEINGGNISISTADDGIHADNYLTINDGTIEISQSYEGIEAHIITVNGGTIRITASDDGVNANGSDSEISGFGGFGSFARSKNTDTDPAQSDSELEPLLTFNGGYTIINAGGDGLDSNGCIYMNGGTVIVYGPTNNGNGAIDYGDGKNDVFKISGGTLLAVGSSGMAQSATNDGQAVITASMRYSISADTVIGILDENSDPIAVFELPKEISSIVFSSPSLISNKSYTIVYGGAYSNAFADNDGVLIGGSYTGYSQLGKVTAK